jgi:hypothetical protein
MIDKLGGLLIKGLLGNGPSSLILGYFNLGPISVEVIEPPIPPKPPTTGGGGGGVPFDGLRPYYIDGRKLVKITVKLPNDKSWIKEYLVTDDRANFIVKVIDTLNKATIKATVKVGAIKQRLITVAASFKRTK